jgi:hypothetical protein
MDEKPHDRDRENDAEDLPEEEAVEHTEETGEIDPSGVWPEGDEDTRTPV